MSTYLVAFVVSKFGFEASQVESNNVMFRIWARKDALDQIAYAKDVGPKMLEFFENYFNVSYPLPKQDMIAIPDFSAGAMENWGKRAKIQTFKRVFPYHYFFRSDHL